jgi:5-dehydro-2-deoxygluconokinase
MTLSDELQLLTVGRVSVDLFAEEPGASFAQAQTFRKSIGGSPTNVAVAAARLGVRTALLTKVGDDGLGDYVKSTLAVDFGVDTRFVGTQRGLTTPVVVAAMSPPDDPQFLMYRVPPAPDSTIALDDVDLEIVRTVPILWVTGGALAAEPSRETVRTLIAERGRRAHVVLDLDYRPPLWESPSDARRELEPVLGAATIAIGNRNECEVALGTGDPDAAADALLAYGLEMAIVKLGAEGALVATADERMLVPPVPVDVVSGLGAGDAFGGALCFGLLEDWAVTRAVEFANAAGAFVASRLMCADAMPTEAEVRALLEAVPR